MEYGYRNQTGNRAGQKGQSYPNLQTPNPLQDVRDLYRQPQEDAYKMQPGRFMPVVNPTVTGMGTTDNRAIIRDGGYRSGDQNFDVRSQSFSNLDDNMRTQWIDVSPIDNTEGRK